MNKKQLRAFIWKESQNTHANVKKIKFLFKGI